MTTTIIQTAKAIASITDRAQRDVEARRKADALEGPSFDRERFLKLCGAWY